MYRIGFIGGGRITQILLQGLQNQNKFLDNLIVCEPDPKVVKQLTGLGTDHNITIGSLEEVSQQDWIFLAVHPPVIKSVLSELKGSIRPTTVVISFAPVITISILLDLLDGHSNIIRMIPNAASLMNKGFNPIAFSKHSNISIRDEIIQFMSVFGDCPEVDESKLEAYAILTAMGPTYLWPQIHQLHKLGQQFGLSEQELNVSVQSMIEHACGLFYSGSLSYDQIMDLIPVKPMEAEVTQICAEYQSKLTGLHDKLKGKSS